MEMKNVGIYANPSKDVNMQGTKMVAKLLRESGIHVSFDAGAIPEGERELIDYSKIDCLFVLGGDGTLLKAAQTASVHGVCILGINLGRLGFLTEVELGDIAKAITLIQDGACYVEERTMLHGSIYADGEKRYEVEALNDIAVLKKDMSRMVRLELFIGGALADFVDCDGMLVSTPTGSTGYSLSAGGPILSPKLDCMLTTPICPHSLHSRTLVVSGDDEIVISPAAPGGIVLSADGVQQTEIHNEETVKIKRSKYKACFLRFHENYFYPLLRSKFLNWDDKLNVGGSDETGAAKRDTRAD